MNRFDSESSVVALFLFESSLEDESGNGNDLSVAAGTITVGQTGPYTGLLSAHFESSDLASAQRADSALSSNFPGKNGTSNTTMTLCVWCSFAELMDYMHPVSKLVTGVGNGWDAFLWETSSHLIGGGWDPEYVFTSKAALISTWYHFSLVVDDANNRVYVRVYDSSNGAVYTAEDLGATSSLPVNNQPFRVGACITSLHPFHGNMAELVIFNRALSNAELEEIEQGEFQSMVTWPDLELWPERDQYPQGVLVDPTIRSGLEGGKPLHHSGDQAIPRKWSYVLRHITPSQKEALQDFQESVGIGAEPFYWTDVRPVSASGAGGGSGGTYAVTLLQPMVFDLDDDGTAYRTEVFMGEWQG